MPPTRLLMIGGFLGAGKTTAIARAARHYLEDGRQVGIVTNDQASGLVDTEQLRAQGFRVGEVPGACFCCNFDDLVDTLAGLADDARPDIILTEPVGSCTDLVATVIEPLRRIHGDAYEIGPFVVLCKPEHGRRILSGRSAGFSPQAAYIFHKQLEEADVLVVNKTDKLTAAERDELVGLVRRHCPEKTVLAASARTGDGFDAVLDALAEPGPQHDRPMVVDYDRYAAGEAELGWLNATATVCVGEVDGVFALDDLLIGLVTRLHDRLTDASAETAHLKALASCPAGTAIANAVESGSPPELSRPSGAMTSTAELIINARVRIDPGELTEHVRAAAADEIGERNLTLDWSPIQSFRPGRPAPTHRVE